MHTANNRTSFKFKMFISRLLRKIKDPVKRILLKLIYHLGYLFRFFYFNKKDKNALILVPAHEGSIGDEAVIDTITQRLKEQGYQTKLIHFENEKGWTHLEYIDSRYGIPSYFKTGGWGDHLRFINIFKKYSYFYLLGTDMMDGCYADWLTNGLIKITNQAAYARLKTTIVGFSINSWQRAGVMKNLGNMHKNIRYCVRDEVSRQRFNKLTHRASILTADMAFMLNPTLKGNNIIEANQWILKKKKQGDTVVGININPQLFDSEKLINELRDSLLNSILDIGKKYENISFFLIPHDFREGNSDIILLNELFKNLRSILTDKINIIPTKFIASDMKGLVKNLDVVITARMHLAIACLGQQIPIGTIVYQGKFKGLFSHFNLPDKYMLSPEEALDPKQLFNFMELIIKNRLTIKEQVIKKLPSVKEKSSLNIIHI